MNEILKIWVIGIDTSKLLNVWISDPCNIRYDEQFACYRLLSGRYFLVFVWTTLNGFILHPYIMNSEDIWEIWVSCMNNWSFGWMYSMEIEVTIEMNCYLLMVLYNWFVV